jgi:succinylglutamate desuccinylase
MSDQYVELFENNLAAIKEELEVEQVSEDIYRLSPKTITVKPVALVGITHGEEVIGLHILNEILRRLLEKKLYLKGELFLILGIVSI